VVLGLILAAAFTASIGLRASRGASITGDEPFYLLTTQSLLDDGDLDLRQQYERRSYEVFFDHADGLWQQSVPRADGMLLSPHNPGLSVLVIPGFAIGGLVGVQAQLLAMAAVTFALAFVLARAVTGAAAWSWWATLAVGLCATPFVYSTDIYPEAPAALALIGALLVIVLGPQRIDVGRAAAVVALLSAIPWLGVKYLPLSVVVGAWLVWRPRALEWSLRGSLQHRRPRSSAGTSRCSTASPRTGSTRSTRAGPPRRSWPITSRSATACTGSGGSSSTAGSGSGGGRPCCSSPFRESCWPGTGEGPPASSGA